MHTIDVDFDVFKKLTVLRETEEVTYNDVIRRLLGLGKSNLISPKKMSEPASGDWVVKGVTFPAGTEFKATYKGEVIMGRVEDSSLVVREKHYDSPSGAAVAITQGPVNGWRFWECRLPGKSLWQSIDRLRS